MAPLMALLIINGINGHQWYFFMYVEKGSKQWQEKHQTQPQSGWNIMRICATRTEGMMEQNDQNKRKALQGYCTSVACAECKISMCNGCVTLNDVPDNEINNLFEAVFNAYPHRITIRDIIDLLDYDRTGIRQIRLVDEQTKMTDTLQTDSYLLQYVEDTPVNALDTVGGVITLYVNYGGGDDA